MKIDALARGIERAHEIGTEHGGNAGSWVIDGNTGTGTLESFARELSIWDVPGCYPPAPLSGEFADGYSPRRLIEDIGIELDYENPEYADIERALCDTYEDAYFTAFEAQVEKDVREFLGKERFDELRAAALQ